MCMSVLPACMPVYLMCVHACHPQNSEKVSDPQLEFWMVLMHHVGVGNRTPGHLQE